MTEHQADCQDLLDRAGRGDASACQQLLLTHQQRLRQMVAVRLERLRALLGAERSEEQR
jgi:hypothetical protein